MAVENTEIVEVWHELLDRYARSVSALERALEHEHGLGVSEYEVLERLASSERSDLRMQELAEAVHLSERALWRGVGRLGAEALVVRKMCAQVRRGISPCLTDVGRTRLEA